MIMNLEKKLYNPIILFACCSRDTPSGWRGWRGRGEVPNPNSPHPLYPEEPHKT